MEKLSFQPALYIAEPKKPVTAASKKAVSKKKPKPQPKLPQQRFQNNSQQQPQVIDTAVDFSVNEHQSEKIDLQMKSNKSLNHGQKNTTPKSKKVLDGTQNSNKVKPPSYSQQLQVTPQKQQTQKVKKVKSFSNERVHQMDGNIFVDSQSQLQKSANKIQHGNATPKKTGQSPLDKLNYKQNSSFPDINKYAGANFQNSPTPDSLPLPIFNKNFQKNTDALVNQSEPSSYNERDILSQHPQYIRLKNFDNNVNETIYSKSAEEMRGGYFPHQSQNFFQSPFSKNHHANSHQHYNTINQNFKFGSIKQENEDVFSMDDEVFQNDKVQQDNFFNSRDDYNSTETNLNLRKKSFDLLYMLNPSSVPKDLNSFQNSYSKSGNLDEIGKELKSMLKIG
ncbi:hypothetical protein HK099_008124 [Clydaea vesicula]|uniref:Uncharacterized protein n=1 Tax=Clydaea vesicula TaxID=447962 RepID=A0AAD5U534_9FUNG|nr:hypothetical protein HK099_008124 [Clydaea vesicula]KAJ3392239.1 hypothetical protein HDU92_008592 [Lobulomyces angularis]